MVSIWGFRNMNWVLEHLALRPGDPPMLQSIECVTYFFVHANFVHLLMNMFIWWSFGPSVENHLGKPRYLLLILLSTVTGGVLTLSLQSPINALPLVGASGGIAGLFVFYCVRFWHRRLVLFSYRYGTLAIPSWMYGFIFLFNQWIGSLGQIAGDSRNISYLDHMGGAAIGLAFGLYYRWPYYVRKQAKG